MAGALWLALVEFDEPFFVLEVQLSRVNKFVCIQMKVNQLPQSITVVCREIYALLAKSLFC